ncbi:hypothetical protein ACIRTV_18505 [Pseudomonas aeruginosa]|uniref:hypothetical protein n=1 Tax=Pseudomonas aeruginosa TaxID=287 RepID=UPI003D9C2B6F
MPYFEISLLARCTVVIEAADAEQAEIHAMTEADSGDFETFDTDLVCESILIGLSRTSELQTLC